MRTKSSRWVVAGLSLAAIGASGVWTVQTLAQNKQEIDGRVYRPDPDAKVRVDVANVEMGALDDNQALLGTFEANREVVVGSPAQGRVLRAGVEEGDVVKAGHVIAQLDGSVLSAQLSGLEASLIDAKKDKARYEALGKHGAIAAQQIDKAGLALAASESQLATLKRQLGHTTVVAPFAGVITSRHFDVGAVVSTGAAMVELVDISRVKLVLNVPERNLSTVTLGKRLAINVDVYPGKAFEGEVTMVSVKGDSAHNFPVHLTLANHDATPLRVGMYGSVKLPRALDEKVLSIPREALVGSAKAASAFIVEDGTARLREITVGRATASRFEVLAGLSADDQVVTTGQINLRDGTVVSTESGERK